MFKISGIIIAAIFLSQGCASPSLKQQKNPSVTSSPSGATVYANGLMLGETPLRVNLYEAFPAGWENMIYQAQGILMIKKADCKDYTLKVSDYILSKPVHAELECGGIIKTEKAVPVEKTTISDTKEVPVRSRTNTQSEIEKRLKNLETLYKKGVITEDEYKLTRQRILSEI